MSLDVEPDRRCPRHVNEPPLFGCGACIEHEQYHREWERAKARTDAGQRSRNAREAARLRRAEIDRCRMCDHDGYDGLRVCDHDPRRGQANAAGIAKCREALGITTTRQEQ